MSSITTDMAIRPRPQRCIQPTLKRKEIDDAKAERQAKRRSTSPKEKKKKTASPPSLIVTLSLPSTASSTPSSPASTEFSSDSDTKAALRTLVSTGIRNDEDIHARLLALLTPFKPNIALKKPERGLDDDNTVAALMYRGHLIQDAIRTRTTVYNEATCKAAAAAERTRPTRPQKRNLQIRCAKEGKVVRTATVEEIKTDLDKMGITDTQVGSVDESWEANRGYEGLVLVWDGEKVREKNGKVVTKEKKGR